MCGYNIHRINNNPINSTYMRGTILGSKDKEIKQH